MWCSVAAVCGILCTKYYLSFGETSPLACVLVSYTYVACVCALSQMEKLRVDREALMAEIESQAGKLVHLNPWCSCSSVCTQAVSTGILSCEGRVWHRTYLPCEIACLLPPVVFMCLCMYVCVRAEVNLRHDPELQEGYEKLQHKYAELGDLKNRFDRAYTVQNEKLAVRLIL